MSFNKIGHLVGGWVIVVIGLALGFNIGIGLASLLNLDVVIDYAVKFNVFGLIPTVVLVNLVWRTLLASVVGSLVAFGFILFGIGVMDAGVDEGVSNYYI